MICRYKLYDFTVANTRFTAPLTRRGKTKFATVKSYNLCLQIIQSQMCYPLNLTNSRMINTPKRQRVSKKKNNINHPMSSSSHPATAANKAIHLFKRWRLKNKKRVIQYAISQLRIVRSGLHLVTYLDVGNFCDKRKEITLHEICMQGFLRYSDSNKPNLSVLLIYEFA